MKEDFDREIDSLLRRRARGTAESRLWGNGPGDGSQGLHLDADELSAFAEGALPAAARVAAVSHLADCERCRGVAVGLARVVVAGAEVKQQAVAATVPAKSERTPAWRGLLASLFSPRVMRFAVPVLALSLVGVVSYVALRSSNRGTLQVARDAGRQPGVLQEPPSAAVAPGASNTNAANANTSGLTDQNTDAAPTEAPLTAAQPEQRKEQAGTEARPAEVPDGSEGAQPSAAAPPPPPPVTTTTEGPADISKAGPRPVTSGEDEVARIDSRDRAESREKSARSAEPADDATSNEAAAAQRRAAQSRMNQVQMPDGSERNQKRADNTSNVYGGGANTAAPPKESERAGTRSEATGRARAARQADKKKADDDEAGRGGGGDTRAAAGHRFRREGNRWVDVKYKTSMPSTGVRRGTEPFRALVADVPEIGRVAEDIEGEVIVVVRGRAYIIR